MNARGIKGLMLSTLAALALPLTTVAAVPDVSPDEQLDEILVEGQKPERNPEKYIEWMARLVGEFVVEGSVDLHDGGESNGPLEVNGRTRCFGFFPTQAVQCELRLRWPEVKGPNGEALLGGVSHLNPAIMLFGYDNDHISIRHMLVGNDAIAEEAKGYLILGRTVVSRNKCVNVPGNCQRVVRITADSDLKEIEMRFDMEVDYKKVASFRFVMHRTQGAR